MVSVCTIFGYYKNFFFFNSSMASTKVAIDNKNFNIKTKTWKSFLVIFELIRGSRIDPFNNIETFSLIGLTVNRNIRLGADQLPRMSDHETALFPDEYHGGHVVIRISLLYWQPVQLWVTYRSPSSDLTSIRDRYKAAQTSRMSKLQLLDDPICEHPRDSLLPLTV